MDHPLTPAPGLPPLIDLETLATYLGVPVATVYDWRSLRLGPPAHRIGERLMFAVPDVQAWMEQQRDLAAELLGHADPRITVQHSIRRNETVDPSTADFFEQAFPPLVE